MSFFDVEGTLYYIRCLAWRCRGHQERQRWVRQSLEAGEESQGLHCSASDNTTLLPCLGLTYLLLASSEKPGVVTGSSEARNKEQHLSHFRFCVFAFFFFFLQSSDVCYKDHSIRFLWGKSQLWNYGGSLVSYSIRTDNLIKKWDEAWNLFKNQPSKQPQCLCTCNILLWIKM